MTMTMRDAMSGPEKDPHNWQALMQLVASVWPQLYAAGMAFVVALVRGLQSGGRPIKTLLEAILCGCLTLAMVPVLVYFGLSADLAVAGGAAIAFLGTEWFRDRADSVARALLDRWLK